MQKYEKLYFWIAGVILELASVAMVHSIRLVEDLLFSVKKNTMP